jgi:glycosyltransferase involved in cell wall biosynthesis
MADFISVCILAFKRPIMLSEVLNGVCNQVTSNCFTYEVVVIDNDMLRSAENTVANFAKTQSIKITYDCEPEKNISLARNRAILKAKGNMIAFIDDDEFPGSDWLLKLYKMIKEKSADGILGPVIPSYPEGTPKWLIKGDIFSRRRFATGTKLYKSRDTRTGNVLFDKKIFSTGELWFNPIFGLTGGEDVDFFDRRIKSGCRFFWCDEAIVYETVPLERCSAVFHIKKYFRVGNLYGNRLRKARLSGVLFFFKSWLMIFFWISYWICTLPIGKHKWMKAVLKITYFSGSIIAFLGLTPSRFYSKES